jgi:IclR family acetate operon transcriptional repressor
MPQIPQPRSAISVSDRMWSVLECFRLQEGPLTLGAISLRTGLPKTTVHRMVAQMARSGFLDRVDDGVTLGMRLFELGHQVPRSRRLRDLALPILEDLQEATRATVHLAVLNGTDALYVEILRPPRTQPLPSRVGGRLPAYCTGVGKALLAHAGESPFAATCKKGLRPLTPSTIRNEGALRAELAWIRANGVAFDREESAVGIVCVATPVFGAASKLLGALSVTGRRNELEVDRLAATIRMAGLSITRRLRDAAAVA